MDTWIGQTLLGRYRVEERLGSGGMAAVYLASDQNLGGRRVVVKHPLREQDRLGSGLTDAELRGRFEREIAGLIHLDEVPGVVPILAQGVHDGTPFYVMRFMAGGSLEDRLAQGPQGPVDVLAWARPVGAALDHLHTRTPGVVHRDVKPPNILFDGEGRAHLSDFGIVKELHAAWATTTARAGAANTRIGTPAYMPPEQLLPDGEVDGRSDQFALAATIYHALTGEPPRYASAAAEGTVRRPAASTTSRKQLVAASELAVHLPGAASRALERGLAREQSERYATCSALVEAFAAGLSTPTRAAPAREGPARPGPARARTGATPPLRATTGRSAADRPAVRHDPASARRRRLLALLALAGLGVGLALALRRGGADSGEPPAPPVQAPAASEAAAPAPEAPVEPVVPPVRAEPEAPVEAPAARSQAPARLARNPDAAAIERGLAWLAAHQSEDGSWEAAGFDRWCDGRTSTGERPDGAGKALYDTGVTGLALCAFLDAGYTNRSDHEFAKVVSRGLRFLRNVQDPEGCFGSRSTQHYVYNHATAALAMVEAYGMTESPIYKGPAQKALDFVALARNPYFAWRYGVKPGDNDTSITGCMLHVLRAAETVNRAARLKGKAEPLEIDAEAFEGAAAWLDKVTDPETGRLGYMTRGTGPARPAELVDRFPGDRSEAMTAVGFFAHLLAGDPAERRETAARMEALCLTAPPVWSTSEGTIDLVYWHFATQAFRLRGGASRESWSRALRRALLPQQRAGDNPCSAAGSWDPVDVWGPDGGRVYSTALALRCLIACAD